MRRSSSRWVMIETKIVETVCTSHLARDPVSSLEAISLPSSRLDQGPIHFDLPKLWVDQEPWLTSQERNREPPQPSARCVGKPRPRQDLPKPGKRILSSGPGTIEVWSCRPWICCSKIVERQAMHKFKLYMHRSVVASACVSIRQH